MSTLSTPSEATLGAAMETAALVFNESMKTFLARRSGFIPRVRLLGGFALAGTLVALASPNSGAVQPPASGRMALTRVADLPAGFRPAGELAGRGVFYATDGRLSARQDDGASHHGFDALPEWEREAGARTQGIVYGVESDTVISAGYLIRQADLVASNSFHGLSLAGLPPVRYATVDLVQGAAGEPDLYLWLWHFRSQHRPPRHMLQAGALPPVESLPPRFSVYACEDAPNVFCPRMGRHYTDRSKQLGRKPTSTGEDGLSYGEAAGKLIFIEYSFAQADFQAGISWGAMPLDGLPIPPVDNVHLLHYEGANGAPGRYTMHMYLIPEEIYLAWDREPPWL